jgi:hypothetical protein
LLQLLQLLSYIQKMEEYVIILDFGRSKLCDKTEEWQQQEEEEELHDLLKGWPAAEEAEEGCQDEKGGNTDSSNDSDSPRRGRGDAVATVAIRDRRYNTPNVRRGGLADKTTGCLPSVPRRRRMALQSAMGYYPTSRFDTPCLPNLGGLLGGRRLSAFRSPWKGV